MVSSPKSAVEALAKEVRTSLVKALPAGGVALVGYSGGVDSTVMLALARQHGCPNISLGAVHINHGLHKRAASWARHCRRRCTGWAIPLEIVDVHVSGRAGGLENRARQARLRAFRSLPADVILLAHHADDQAETVLLRTLRGAGLRGLGAMRECSKLQGSAKKVLRPLLHCSKDELLAVGRELSVRGVRDPSNQDLRHNRNWLRHSFLPEARRRFPGALAALGRVASNASQAESLLGALARADDAAVRNQGTRELSQARLAELGPNRVRNWLVWSLVKRGQPTPATRHLAEAARQICASSASFKMNFAGLLLAGDHGKMSWSVQDGGKIGKIRLSQAHNLIIS